LAIPQLPLTLINSVFALCALSKHYFPERPLEPGKVSASVGLMNLICVPIGGFPMCHGSGGLAAQYRFGARTGGGVIMVGGLKIVIGLMLGTFLIGLLKDYPMAVLAPMLILAGFELVKSGWKYTNVGDLVVMLVTALSIVLINTVVGFLVGCLLILVHRIYSTRSVVKAIPDCIGESSKP